MSGSGRTGMLEAPSGPARNLAVLAVDAGEGVWENIPCLRPRRPEGRSVG